MQERGRGRGRGEGRTPNAGNVMDRPCTYIPFCLLRVARALALFPFLPAVANSAMQMECGDPWDYAPGCCTAARPARHITKTTRVERIHKDQLCIRGWSM